MMKGTTTDSGARYKVTYTERFINEYPYSYDDKEYFMGYWLHPFLREIHESKKVASDAIDAFIDKVKREFGKFDYGNDVLPKISRKWFEIIPYEENEMEYDY